MTETPSEAWRRKGFIVRDDKLVPTMPQGARNALPAALFLPKNKNGTASPLEASFLRLWIECNGPELEREKHLVPGRLWRCDFYHEASKIVVELEGYGKGHTNLASFRKDAAKYLTLTLMGFTVIRLTSDLVEPETVKKVISYVRKHSLPQGKKVRLCRE